MAFKGNSIENYEIGQEKSIVAAQIIGAASALISVAKRRQCYIITNTSVGGQIITLSLSNTDAAVAGSGIVLTAGQHISDSNGENYLCWTGRISGISSAAGGTISIFERSID